MISRSINGQQAELLMRLVPRERKYQIEQDDKGNCRNQYFQLLKMVQNKHGQMAFEKFCRKIEMPEDYHYQV